jgi:hypothetical protein
MNTVRLLIPGTTSGSQTSTSRNLAVLLGSSLLSRKVVLKKIDVQVLTNSGSPQTFAIQLAVNGPIWTGSNVVPAHAFKQTSTVNPTNLSITSFLPTMKVPLDSEDINHSLVVNIEGLLGTGENAELLITTYCELLPQQTLTVI